MSKMPQRRGWKPPKQDHSVYVQQLFRDFLTRNNGSLAAPAAAVAPQIDTRTNFFPLDPMNIPEQRKQPGIFDRAVYARFERDTKNGGYMRQEPTVGAKTGLMRWIDQQRNQRVPRNQALKSARTDDYLNLPGNFFSGTEQITLPLEVTDRTLGNVTTTFIPPATSTPFDRMASFGISGVLSDPAEFQSNPSSNSSTRSSEANTWDQFLNRCKEYLTGITKDIDRTNVLYHHRKDLESLLRAAQESVDEHVSNQPELPMETLLATAENHDDSFKRSSWRDHSLISNQNYYHNRTRKQTRTVSPPMYIPEISFTMMSNSPGPPPVAVNLKKRNNVTFMIESCSQPDSNHGDILLTASPPSPGLSTSRKHCFHDENTFLLDQMPADDTLMEKLDALLADDGFEGRRDSLDYHFHLATPMNQPTMNITFPSNRFGVANDTLDDMVDVDMAATPFNLSQDFSFAPTMPELRKPLF